MFRCKEITEDASRYVDHKLSFVERMQYSWHLFICHHCRRFIAQFRLSITTLVNLPIQPPEEAIAKQVEAVKAAHKAHYHKH